MPEWLVRFIGVRSIDPAGAGVRFEFAHALTSAQWALVFIVCVLAAWFGYRGLRAGAGRWMSALKWTGVTCRAGVLLLIAFLLTGPRFVEVQERVEKDWVLALADRSSSLTIADGRGESGGLITREQEFQRLIDGTRPVWKSLDGQRVVRWLGFDAGTYELAAVDGVPTLPGASGRRTDIAAALEQALAKAAARPVSGIVLFSDGRSVSPIPRALVKRLAAEKVPVIVVPLGSMQPLADLAVSEVLAPTTAFVNDPVPVQITITRTGTATIGPTLVELINPATGEKLDTQRVEWAAGETTKKLTLTSATKSAGNAAWQVKLTPSSSGTERADLIEANNARDVRLTLVDRPLRLVYIDGYPRWEYRFLKNILARERSLKFSATLLASGRRYLEEGSEELAAVPETAAEWNAVDVIMLGDVQPNVLTPKQLEQIRDRVSVGGAGLIWIAGQGAVPGAYKGTPLGDLLPIMSGAIGDRLQAWDRDVVMKPAPLADQLGVLRLADRQPDNTYWPPGVSDPLAGWSRLRWAQRLEPSALKPAAEALALAAPVDGIGMPTPLVVTMRYGAGRIIYIATDEIWRYRYGRGEDLPERFYLQLVRLLGRESVARSGQAAIMELSPTNAEVGVPVRVSVQLLDQSLLESHPASLSVKIVRESGGDPEKVDLTLRPTSEQTGASRTFVGSWVPSSIGTWKGSVTDALLGQAGPGVNASAEVFLPNDELRHPETDHLLLTQLAQETGGAVMNAEALLADGGSRLSQLLPRREVRTLTTAKEETIWDKPIMLLGLLVLLTVEWIARKLLRMV